MRTAYRALAALGLFAPIPAQAASTYYVAPKGSDSADGSEAAPWASIARAQSSAAAGDTIYIRGGVYQITAGTNTCSGQTATVNAIALTKSGTAVNPIKYWAYAGEKPVFDFSELRADCRVKGFDVTGDYLHLKGITVTGVKQRNNQNHESWGVWVSGSNNVFELLDIFHIDGTGLFIQNGSNNLVLNCDSHENFDPLTSNGACESGDGFGAHVSANNPGNVFRGCRAWFNSDDDFDLINAFSSVTIENCWAWHAGYRYDTGASCGNGNGFKCGGYGTDTSKFPANPPVHVIRKNLSVANKAAGFYANHHPGSVSFYNNTSYGNHPDFNMLGMNPSGADITVGSYRNNLAVGGTLISNASNPDDDSNSWTLSSVTVSTADLSNATETGLDAPRQADGSLPPIDNFQLVAGSDLIDKGVDVGLAYLGSAPDLGCFEVGESIGGSSSTGGTRATGPTASTGGGTHLESGASSAGGSGGLPSGSLGRSGAQSLAAGRSGMDSIRPSNGGAKDGAAPGGLGGSRSESAVAPLGGTSAKSGAASARSPENLGGSSSRDTRALNGTALRTTEENSDGCSCRIAAESQRRGGGLVALTLCCLGCSSMRRHRRTRV